MKYIVSLFFVVVSVFSVTASAQSDTDCKGASVTGKAVEVIFVNGIRNKKETVRCSADTLASHLVSAEFPAGSFDYSFFYNPTAGFLTDYSEMVLQASLSKTASLNTYQVSSDARYNYYYNLGKIYTEAFAAGLHTAEGTKAVYKPTYDLVDGLRRKSDAGKKLILVPHSQGNFYVEAAYGVFLYEEHIVNTKGKYTDNIRVVGVAPVSATTPNDKYVRVEEDQAVSLFMTDTSLDKTFTILPATDSICLIREYSYIIGRGYQCVDPEYETIFSIDSTVHGFVEIYLNLWIAYTKDTSDAPYLTITKYIQDFVREFTKVVPTPTWEPLFQVQKLSYGVSNVVFFDAKNSEGDVSTFSFSFGDNSPSVTGVTTAAHAYTAPGVYTVTLSGNKGGVISSCSLQVTVTPVTVPPTVTLFEVCK